MQVKKPAPDVKKRAVARRFPAGEAARRTVLRAQIEYIRRPELRVLERGMAFLAALRASDGPASWRPDAVTLLPDARLDAIVANREHLPQAFCGFVATLNVLPELSGWIYNSVARGEWLANTIEHKSGFQIDVRCGPRQGDGAGGGWVIDLPTGDVPGDLLGSWNATIRARERERRRGLSAERDFALEVLIAVCRRGVRNLSPLAAAVLVHREVCPRGAACRTLARQGVSIDCDDCDSRAMRVSTLRKWFADAYVIDSIRAMFGPGVLEKTRRGRPARAAELDRK